MFNGPTLQYLQTPPEILPKRLFQCGVYSFKFASFKRRFLPTRFFAAGDLKPTPKSGHSCEAGGAVWRIAKPPAGQTFKQRATRLYKLCLFLLPNKLLAQLVVAFRECSVFFLQLYDIFFEKLVLSVDEGKVFLEGGDALHVAERGDEAAEDGDKFCHGLPVSGPNFVLGIKPNHNAQNSVLCAKLPMNTPIDFSSFQMPSTPNIRQND